MKQRDYQIKAEADILQSWKDGNRTVLAVLPTGAGKTILFSLMILHMKVKTIVMCERKELVLQTAKKIKEVTGLCVEVEMGEMRSTSGDDLLGIKADVIVTTVQTQYSGGDGFGRMLKFNPDEFGLFVVDEYHHGASKSYQDVLNYFKKNPKLKILGVTATPDKLVEFELGEVFDHIAFEYPLWDGENLSAIKDGWLCPIVQQFVPVSSFDISHVKSNTDDLSGADLEAVLKAEKPMQQFVEGIFEIMHGLPVNSLNHLDPKKWADQVVGKTPKRSIAFTRFVEHARMLSGILNRIQPGISDYVYGKQEKNERLGIVNRFKNGTGPSIIVNCNVLGEGYDDDGVKIVFTVCPTKSRDRYAQWIGRGTRPLKEIADKLGDLPHAAKRRWLISVSEKKECLVVDFVGNSGKHKLVSCVDVLGISKLDEVLESAGKIMRQSGLPMRVEKTIEEQEIIIADKKKREAEELARKGRLIGKATYKVQTISAFDLLQIKPSIPRGWDNKRTFTEGSCRLLRNVFKVDPNQIEYPAGMALIKEFYRRKDAGECTFGQAKILKKHGLDIHMKFADATKAIDGIAQSEGWQSGNAVSRKLGVPAYKTPVLVIDDDDNIPF